MVFIKSSGIKRMITEISCGIVSGRIKFKKKKSHPTFIGFAVYAGILGAYVIFAAAGYFLRTADISVFPFILLFFGLTYIFYYFDIKINIGEPLDKKSDKLDKASKAIGFYFLMSIYTLVTVAVNLFSCAPGCRGGDIEIFALLIFGYPLLRTLTDMRIVKQGFNNALRVVSDIVFIALIMLI